MRAYPIVLMLALGCAAPPAFGEEKTEDHSAHHPTQSSDAKGSVDQPHGTGGALQENMRKIEELMLQIKEADDPARKQELLAQHAQALQQQMRLMAAQRADEKLSMKEAAGKSDAAGAGQPGKEGDMMHDAGMMKGGGMMMHKKLEQRIGMLERLLEQVIEHEAVESGTAR